MRAGSVLSENEVRVQRKQRRRGDIKYPGPEYLRIIYGPEYQLSAKLERLRARVQERSALSPVEESPWESRRSQPSLERSLLSGDVNYDNVSTPQSPY